jgi:hypothetical protein
MPAPALLPVPSGSHLGQGRDPSRPHTGDRRPKGNAGGVHGRHNGFSSLIGGAVKRAG